MPRFKHQAVKKQIQLFYRFLRANNFSNTVFNTN